MRRCVIAIVNYKTAAMVVDCLQALAAEMAANPGYRVVIADNASPDDSVLVLRRAIADNAWSWATVLPLADNRGFAAGNNAILKDALREEPKVSYFHLLNPDTIPQPGAVTRLIEFMEHHPKAGIAGSRLLDAEGVEQVSSFRFHGVLSELERGTRLGLLSRLLKPWMVAPPPDGLQKPAQWVSGASLMIHRFVIETIGLMDEDYFLYFEETDYCLRARRAGFQIYHVPGSVVTHLEGASTGVTGARVKKRLPRYWLESRQRFLRKNYGWLKNKLADLAYILGYGSWRIRRWIQRKPDPDPPHLWWDFTRFSLFGR